MANSRKISLLWQEKQITVLEVDKNQPIQSGVIDLSSVYQEASFSANLTEEVQIVSLLQENLKKFNTQNADFILALSNDDVIVRSFIIPALKPSEIFTAVQFEAKKYIPFDIKELKFTFHTTPIVENKIKRLRVILYAVKKDVLEKYTNIIKKAGLKLVSCEPAVVGLCRAILSQHHVTPQAQVAILDINQETGNIYFIDHGTAVFVREFQFSLASMEKLNIEDDPEVMRSRVFNEIRNSFDFYSRQYAEHIDKLMVYSSDEMYETILSFENDMDVKVSRFTATFAGGGQSFAGVDLLSCFGVCLPPQGQAAPLTDLLAERKVVQKSILDSLPAFEFDVREFAPCLKILVPVIFACAAVYALLYFQQQELNKQYQALASQQGEFAVETKDDLQNKINTFNAITENFKHVRLKTDLHILSLLIFKHVQQGMWLKDLNIRFANSEDKAATVDFVGYVYLPEVNNQVKSVNEFVRNLRADKKIANYINKVQLLSISRLAANGVTYTEFRVSANKE